jgi:tape measure domain-containing protein
MFNKLGIEMVAKGAATFARDIGHVSAAMIAYGRTVDTANIKIKSLYNTEVKIAKQRVSIAKQQQKQILDAYKSTGTEKEITRLTKLQSKLRAMQKTGITATGAAMNPEQFEALAVKIKRVTNALGGLKRTKEYKTYMKELGNATSQVAKEMDALERAQKRASETGSSSSGIFNMFRNVIEKIKPTVGQVVIAFDILKLSINTVLSIFSIGIGIVTSFVGAFVNLGKTILNVVLSPIKLLGNVLQKLWGSIKNILEITIGMTFSRILWGVGASVRQLADNVVQAASNFQLLEVRLQTLMGNEIKSTTGINDMSQAIKKSIPIVKDYFKQIVKLGIETPYSAQDISNIFTLGMSYKLTSEESWELVKATTTFASGMGLTGDAIKRVVENMGQMIAAGKITGTEIRDLARGSFVPVNRLFDIMGERLDIVTKSGKSMKETIMAMSKDGKVGIKEFINAFIELSETDFEGIGERISSTWEVVKSNSQELLDTLLGFYVLKPALDVIGSKMQAFIESLFSDSTISTMSIFGSVLAKITESLFDFSNVLEKSSFGKNLQGKMSGMANSIRGMGVALGIVKRNTGTTGKDLMSLFKLWQKPINTSWAKNWREAASFIEKVKGERAKELKGMFGVELSDEDIDQMQNGFDIIQSISDFVTEHTDDITMMFSHPLRFMKEKFFPFIVNGFKNLIENVIPSLGSVLSRAWSGFAGYVRGPILNAIDAMKNAANNPIFSTFIDILTDIVNLIFGSGGGVTQGAHPFASNQTKMDIFANLLNSVKSLIDQGLNKLWEFATGKVPALQPISDFFKGLNESISAPKNVKDMSDSIDKFVGVVVGGAEALITFTNFTLALLEFLKFIGGIATWPFETMAKVFSIPVGGGLNFLDFSGQILEGMGKMNKALDMVKAWDTQKIEGVLKLLRGDTTGAQKNIGELQQSMLDSAEKNTSESLDKIVDLYLGHKSTTEEVWQTLSDDLVGNSIIPDMMTDIYNAIFTKLQEIQTNLPTQLSSILTAVNVNEWITKGTELGQYLINGINSGFNGGFGAGETGITGATGQMQPMATEQTGSTIGGVGGVAGIAGLVQGFVTALNDTFIAGFQTIIATVVQFVIDFAAEFTSLKLQVINIANQMGTALKSEWNGIAYANWNATSAVYAYIAALEALYQWYLTHELGTGAVDHGDRLSNWASGGIVRGALHAASGLKLLGATPAIVGEQGAEAWIPAVSGRILSNVDAKNALVNAAVRIGKRTNPNGSQVLNSTAYSRPGATSNIFYQNSYQNFYGPQYISVPNNQSLLGALKEQSVLGA